METSANGGTMDRLLQIGGSGSHNTDNIACSRSEIREERERLERANQTPTDLTPTQRLGQYYAELHRREQAAKDAERARLIKDRKIIINPDGSETHYMQGNRY